MKKIKIGIIGCGWFGNFHLDYLLTRSDVEVVALVNRGQEALVKTGRKVSGANLYNSFEEMITKEPVIDALLVCVPPHEHNQIELTSAKNGINLYIEKPLSNSLKEAIEISRAIAKSGIICSVGYQERYANGIGQVRDMLKNSSPYLFSGSWIDSTPGATWWWDKAKSGGQIVEQATHIVDLMRYFLGEAKEVSAIAGKPHPQASRGVNVDSCSVSTITLSSGAVGVLTTGCFSSKAMPPKVALEILGENFQVEYKHNNGVNVITTDNKQSFPYEGDNHQKALGSFLDSVKAKTSASILSSYEDALKTFKLTLALEKSIAEKGIVGFDEL